MTEATYEIDRMTKLCEELRLALQRQREVNDGLVKLLQGLTPGGSEFIDPAACARYVRQGWANTSAVALKVVKERNACQAVNEGLLDALRALQPYGRHERECACRQHLAAECNCGWRSVNCQADAAIAAARPTP